MTVFFSLIFVLKIKVRLSETPPVVSFQVQQMLEAIVRNQKANESVMVKHPFNMGHEK